MAVVGSDGLGNRHVLNFDDLPEALLPSGKQSHSRHTVDRKKMVPAIGNDGECGRTDADEDWHHEHTANVDHSFHAISDLNSDVALVVEKFHVAQLDELLASNESEMQSSTWPTAQESVDDWTRCEISSMASSWLDVGVVDDLDLGDDASNACDNALITQASIVASRSARNKTSWASKIKLASQMVGQTSRAPPRSGVPIPPLRHQPKQRQQTSLEEDDGSQNPFEFGDKRSYKAHVASRRHKR